MKKRSKRYKDIVSKTNDKVSSIEEAIKILRENPTNFDQGVELHVKLGINSKKSDQIVRGIVQLPHGTGKTKKVIAFVAPEQEAEAKEAGADIIGNEEVIQAIKTTGKVNFEVAVATPAMMKKIGPIAKILGQKGLMPNPKTETISPDVKKMITGVKAGKIAFKNDDSGNVHVMVGKISFDDFKIKENIKSLVSAINKARPSGSKGTFFKNAVLCTSMSPAVRVNIS